MTFSVKYKGILTNAREWCKHYRPFGKRLFWSKERAAEQRYIRKERE